MRAASAFACALLIAAGLIVALRCTSCNEGYASLRTEQGHDTAQGGHDEALGANTDDEDYDTQGAYNDPNTDQDQRDPDEIRAESYTNPVADASVVPAPLPTQAPVVFAPASSTLVASDLDADAETDPSVDQTDPSAAAAQTDPYGTANYSETYAAQFEGLGVQPWTGPGFAAFY